MEPSVTSIMRILFLDSFTGHLPKLESRGIKVQLTEERTWNTELYEASPATLSKIRDLTASGVYDIVILGNMLGAGVAKAKAVNPRLRSRTIVVWNEYVPGVEKPYAALGYAKFMSRIDLRKYIVTLITN